MIRGVYSLTSSMLTRNKELGVISNNMANLNTQGFKADKLITSSKFSTAINLSENGDINPMGKLSLLVGADDTKTNFIQGNLKTTGRELDFALAGSGFFEINTPDGLVYTRNGSFTIDNEGYLVLQGVGRVQGENGDIRIYTNDFTADAYGNINVGGLKIDKISIKDFENYDNIIKNKNGMFVCEENVQPINVNDKRMAWQTVETSNVDMMEQMTSMMTSQRTIQSCSQFIKISDQLIGKVISEVGGI